MAKVVSGHGFISAAMAIIRANVFEIARPPVGCAFGVVPIIVARARNCLHFNSSV